MFLSPTWCAHDVGVHPPGRGNLGVVTRPMTVVLVIDVFSCHAYVVVADGMDEDVAKSLKLHLMICTRLVCSLQPLSLEILQRKA
jgi:hypothetical protein